MWNPTKKPRSSCHKRKRIRLCFCVQSTRPILKEEEEKIAEPSGTNVDALPEFLSSVESALGAKNKKLRFRYFMDEMQRGREARSEIEEKLKVARSGIEDLLKGHQELLAQFKTLFPLLERGEVNNPPQNAAAARNSRQ